MRYIVGFIGFMLFPIAILWVSWKTAIAFVNDLILGELDDSEK
jgi:hypothetical protein